MALTWTEFEKVEMRVGTILEVNDFPEARKRLTSSPLILVPILEFEKLPHKLPNAIKKKVY